MPALLRSLLGFIILIATIGLATCQSMLRTEPPCLAFVASSDCKQAAP